MERERIIELLKMVIESLMYPPGVYKIRRGSGDCYAEIEIASFERDDLYDYARVLREALAYIEGRE